MAKPNIVKAAIYRKVRVSDSAGGYVVTLAEISGSPILTARLVRPNRDRPEFAAANPSDLLTTPLVLVLDADLTASATYATLTTALTGANNDLIYTAKEAGTAGNSITIQYVLDAGAVPPIVYVNGSAIRITCQPGTTAATVKSQIDGSPTASALVSIANASGNDGSGAIAAMAATALSGGAAAGALSVQVEDQIQLADSGPYYTVQSVREYKRTVQVDMVAQQDGVTGVRGS